MSEATPVFQIQRLYLKDMSLEQPNSPGILLEQEQPNVDIQLGVEATPLAEGMFEVMVTATVQTRIKDKTVFLVEAKQAGIFEIRNVPEEQMGAIMGIACPQIVYPYLRGNVADVINRAGFPPVHLTEINFQAMYEQQRAQAANQPSPIITQ
ncbi:protein-export chaperone SecB [Acidovorax sp.]|uniref:protein-export chaperone SecB n=1 Tax=Acidovorax sp. TaxID=1872122 RepID=UPI00391EF9F1